MVSMDILDVLNAFEDVKAEPIKGIDPCHKVGFDQQRLLLFDVSQSRVDVPHRIVEYQVPFRAFHSASVCLLRYEAGWKPNACAKRGAKRSQASGLTSRGGRWPWKICTNCSAFHCAMRWRESTVTPAV